VLVETQPEISVAEVKAKTEASFRVSEQLI
jgi:hypothetical protein